MTDLPTERPAQPREDLGAADIGTLVEMGWAEPPPEPEPAPLPET